MSLDYLAIFKSAFWIAWKQKYLWIFGLFLFIFRWAFSSLIFLGSDFHFANISWREGFGFALVFALMFLAFLARASLLEALGRITKNKKSNLRIALDLGRLLWRPLLNLSFLVDFFILGFCLTIFWPVLFSFLNQGSFLSWVLGVAAFLIAIPVLTFAIFSKIYGRIYLVLGKISVMASLENGYRLFLKNVASSLGLIFFLFFFNLVFISLLFLAFLWLGVFFGVLALVLEWFFSQAAAMTALVLGILVIGFILLWAASFAMVFFQAVWILFFQEIAKIKEEELVVSSEIAENLPVSGAVKAFREE